MSSVIEAINDLGVKVEHIPGAYTGLCLPADVSFNEQFKEKMKKMWEEGMMESGVNEETSEVNIPHWQDIANWVSQAHWDVPSDEIINSWRHSPYNFFD